jgi:cell division protein FtsI/penicillin-binding protein 2
MLGCVLNDGMWSPLRTTEAWTDEQNRVTEEITAFQPRRAITEKAARQTRQMLIQVVEKGTAKLGRSEFYEIGGKTGTANKLHKTDPKKYGYDRTRQVVSFLGFIAASDGPRLAGLVIIDEPKLASNLNYGGRLAAPLFRRIAEKAMTYYEVPAFFAANEDTGKAVKKTR